MYILYGLGGVVVISIIAVGVMFGMKKIRESKDPKHQVKRPNLRDNKKDDKKKYKGKKP